MSDQDRRLYACEGKFGFESALTAKKVGKRMRGRDKNAHAFRCEFCGKWHLGSRIHGRPTPRRSRLPADDWDAW